MDGADALAHDMERKWGVGRLRLLVSAELREKFDRQRLKLNEVLMSGDVADVQREADRMCNGWRALDQAAEEAGAKKLEGQWWECGLPDGRVVALVKSSEDAVLVHASGRHLEVWSLTEIGHIIASFPEIAKCKQVFPGARVDEVRRPIIDPLEAWERTQTDLNDEIGF